MNCKLHIKQLLNIHPNHEYSYLKLYKLAYNMPHKAQYLERMAAAMAAELDLVSEYRKACDDNPMLSFRSVPITAGEVISRRESYRIHPGSISFVPPGHCVPTTQQSVMKFDPATGADRPYPSNAAQYRKFHGGMAWLFNPWTGERRLSADIGRDVFGSGIKEPTNG